ncbi:MAG: hypothetical protein IKS70_04590 [Bacteroides sp.]|nr:hypothetical protein [Bacteroides sp.]
MKRRLARQRWFIHLDLSQGQAVSFAKEGGRILSGGYFLNIPFYGGQAEEKRAFQAGRIPLF